MSSVQFKLETFEGPLDLLLHLISKHKLNIHDIQISLLLEQYLEYMHQLEHTDLEDAADFLEMAARLIYIKTVSLLPHDEEAQELKKELEGRLIEYSQCKYLAGILAKGFAGGEIFVRKPAVIPVDKTYTREHEPEVLLEAYLGLSEKARNEKPINAKIFQPIVSHKVVSLGTKIVYILKKLYTDGVCDLSHIYDGMNSKSERVATFLAILELTKSGRIVLNDDNTQISFSDKTRSRKKLSKQQGTQDGAFEQTDVADKSAVPDRDENAEKTGVDNEIPEFTAQGSAAPLPDEQRPPKLYIGAKQATERIGDRKPVIFEEPKANEQPPQQETAEPQAEESVQEQEDTAPEQANEQPPQQETAEPQAEQTAQEQEDTAPEQANEQPPQQETAEPQAEQTAQEQEDTAPEQENEQPPQQETAEPQAEQTAQEQENTAPEQANEQPPQQETAEPQAEESVQEQEDTTPEQDDEIGITPFKPSYWNRLRYFWGCVPVGDDAVQNYWRYGKAHF